MTAGGDEGFQEDAKDERSNDLAVATTQRPAGVLRCVREGYRLSFHALPPSTPGVGTLTLPTSGHPTERETPWRALLSPVPPPVRTPPTECSRRRRLVIESGGRIHSRRYYCCSETGGGDC